MNLRTTTRASAALGLALTLLGVGTLAFSPSANALEYERITVGENETVTASFGPILAPDAVGHLSTPTSTSPETCAVAAYCDVIPLTIKQPRTFDADDAEYFVKVSLEWPSVVIENSTIGEQSATDLELFITNDPFVEDAGPDENGFAYKSASAGNPEFVQMYMPAGDWHILVSNYASAPTNYTITAEWLTRELPGTPFESLPPTFSETGTVSPAKPSLASPPSTQPTPPAVFTPEPVEASLAPATPPVADASFDDGFDDDGGLSDAIAAPPTTVLDFQPSSADEGFPAPSGLSLILWLLALPLLLVAIVGWLLQRRHTNDLAF